MNGFPMQQSLDREDKELVESIYKRLEVWKQGCMEIHDRARVARKILLLQDPYQDPPGTDPKKKTIQLQTLKSTYNNSLADQIDNAMEAKMLPEVDVAQDIVDDLNDIVGYIYEYNNYPALHKKRAGDFLCTGTSITQVLWDDNAQYGSGEITFVRVPVEQFLWDPAEEDIQEARALYKISWHPMSWYESHYPEQVAYISPDEKSADAVGEEINQDELMGDERKAMLIEYWWREYDAAKRRYKVNVAYCAGRALLEKHMNVYAHGMYPFVVDVHTDIEGLPVGEGMVQELVPMMRYINRYAKYMDANIRASAKTRLLVRRDSGLDPEELADWNNDIIPGDRIDQNSVNFMQSPPLSNLSLNLMLQMQSDMKQDSGQNQFQRGESAGGITAASAINSMQEVGAKQTRMRTGILKDGFKRITEQVLWLIAQFYDEKRVVRITGRDGVLRKIDASSKRLMATKGGNTVPPPPYIVRVEVQRMNPDAVSEQNQLFIDAYKMSVEAQKPMPLSTLFRILNVDGKDRLIPIIDSSENYAETLQMMQQQNEQLSQQVQQQQQSIEGLKNSLVSKQTQAAPQINIESEPFATAQ